MTDLGVVNGSEQFGMVLFHIHEHIASDLSQMRAWIYPDREPHWLVICDKDVRAKVLAMCIRDRTSKDGYLEIWVVAIPRKNVRYDSSN
jgi:hypothetical protein